MEDKVLILWYWFSANKVVPGLIKLQIVALIYASLGCKIKE